MNLSANNISLVTCSKRSARKPDLLQRHKGSGLKSAKSATGKLPMSRHVLPLNIPLSSKLSSSSSISKAQNSRKLASKSSRSRSLTVLKDLDILKYPGYVTTQVGGLSTSTLLQSHWKLKKPVGSPASSHIMKGRGARLSYTQGLASSFTIYKDRTAPRPLVSNCLRTPRFFDLTENKENQRPGSCIISYDI